MFDIFYSGIKPGVFVHEQQADSITHAQQLSRTEHFWWVSYLCDYSMFDWNYQPVPWQAHQRHAWPSQWQKDSGTYLVSKADYTETNYHQEQIKRKSGVPIIEIDHLDTNAGRIPDTIKTVRYFDNYKDTLERIAKSVKGQYEYVWICSSICDYSNFDFSWHPDPWQLQLLHVFSSADQKFGDTFLMHVDSFASRINQFVLLDWYDVNFVDSCITRRPMPIIQHDQDSHVDAVKTMDWAGPLALFTTANYVDQPHVTVPLWRTEVKAITPIQSGAQSVIVPRTAVPGIKTQLYDYPYIDRTKQYLVGDPLDIVFISNNEHNAEANFAHLNSVTYNLKNRLHRVAGVNGRAAAYHAAAEISRTAWFFAVFAKLEVDQDFDWSWQPDRMQQAKHYIFHARNPVNGLEYGHMSMIAYNKKLTLNNPGVGLDFTLDSPHEVVPVVSGTAYYNHGAWQTWRTAFREVIKLQASLPDIESEYRLNRWLTVGEKPYGEWSVRGAQDAVEFYNSVNGNMDELRKSYEWAWLATYAFMKRSLTTAQ